MADLELLLKIFGGISIDDFKLIKCIFIIIIHVYALTLLFSFVSLLLFRSFLSIICISLCILF